MNVLRLFRNYGEYKNPGILWLLINPSVQSIPVVSILQDSFDRVVRNVATHTVKSAFLVMCMYCTSIR